jgi:transposase
MHRFIDGEDRMQQALLPHSLEDYVSAENPVRVIEVFIDELDLAALGFSGMTPAATGRPAYHPSTLLKIYLYGYLNRVQSSRRLEREAQRNIELMWLVGRLAPDFKTIADFRKNNGAAIRAVCGQFVELCRRLKLFTRAVVAIDGSKFKAVNNRDKNYTVAKVTGRMEQVDASIARYLRALDRADREEGDVAEAKSVRLKEKIAGPADAGLEGDGADGSGRTRPAGLADRSRRPIDGYQRQRHRHRRLQCTDRRRCRAPSDRGPRGDQPGI